MRKKPSTELCGKENKTDIYFIKLTLYNFYIYKVFIPSTLNPSLICSPSHYSQIIIDTHHLIEIKIYLSTWNHLYIYDI